MIPISKLRAYYPLIKDRKRILPTIFKDRDRVYIPFRGEFGCEAPFPLRFWFKRNGYRLVNYKLGLAQHKRKGDPIRIGKLLRKQNEPELLHLYEKDPYRACCKEYEFNIVLCRHPYDVLGMSRGRGWRSCYSLRNYKTAKNAIEVVQRDGIVFYLCSLSDTNIQNPTGRRIMFLNDDGLYTTNHDSLHGMVAHGFDEAIVSYLRRHHVLIAYPKVYPQPE